MNDAIYKYYGRNPILTDEIGVNLTWECFKDRMGGFAEIFGGDDLISMIDLESDAESTDSEKPILVYEGSGMSSMNITQSKLAPRLSDIPDEILYNCYEGDSSGEISNAVNETTNYDIFQDNFIGDVSKSTEDNLLINGY